MMYDKEKNLWAHSYWVKAKRAFPKRDLFWGRGNGWVICSFPMILDNIGSDHKEAEEIISLKPYLIKPNEEEAELLTGMRPTNIEEAARIAAAIRDSGCECVMLTIGGNGAALAAPSGEYTAIAPEVEVLSTVGAGDSSLAGFIAAISEGKDHPEALRRAVSYGSAACMSEGSLPPTPENVAALLPLVEIKRLND